MDSVTTQELCKFTGLTPGKIESGLLEPEPATEAFMHGDCIVVGSGTPIEES
jgi:hypothetical protein